jgi:hypothetical protein
LDKIGLTADEAGTLREKCKEQELTIKTLEKQGIFFISRKSFR